MDYQQIYTREEIQEAMDRDASLVYFSSHTCNVCKVLKPKVAEMIHKHFHEMNLFYLDIEKSPLLSGQFRIFTIPTILVFFEGKEFFRLSRNIGLDELQKGIERPYKMLFPEDQ